MFTGLVQDLGRIEHAEHSGGGVRLTIATRLAGELATGDSVAVNGVCLTATNLADGRFQAEVMNETLAKSSLHDLPPDTEVNLELPLRATGRLGGHVVQGHVDGVGEVIEVMADGFARRVRIHAPESVLRYVVSTGSVAVDGVSLTVAGLDATSFTVSLIPETLQRTNLARVGPGATVNLEVDVLAKYVERLLGVGR